MLEAIWRDNSLWSAASAACIPPSDGSVRSCAHLIEVNTVAKPGVVQDIMFGAAGEYFSWPAIRTDSAGNLYVSLTHSDPSIFAEARVAGRTVKRLELTEKKTTPTELPRTPDITSAF